MDRTRARSGYISRQSTYHSSARITSKQTDQDVTFAQSAAAAQRIVSDLSTEPTRPPVVNYAGSFDMLAMRKPSIVSSKPSVNQALLHTHGQAPVPRVIMQSAPSAVIVQKQQIATAVEPSQAGGVLKRLNIKPLMSTPKILVGMAIVLFLTGTVISVLSLQTNKDVAAQVKGIQKNEVNRPDSDGASEGGIPDESGNPPVIGSYKTPLNDPRVIRISKTNTEARILALDVGKSGALKAPVSIFDAGWYQKSARPGEPGAMVVDGHVYGPTKPAVFKKLNTLVAGDQIEIERGDGKKFVYTIQASELVDADKLDMSKVMVSYVAGKPGLNVITCGGKFDTINGKYPQRTVVYAVME